MFQTLKSNRGKNDRVTNKDFAERYGPWAVIAGASEGTGRAFARQIAAKGVRCILIARREAPLLALAQEIQVESGVECVTASINLAAARAADRIAAVVGDREVGLYVSNAGVDPNGSLFLDKDIAAWNDLVNRNVMATMQCCHRFGKQMARAAKAAYRPQKYTHRRAVRWLQTEWNRTRDGC